MQVVRQGLARNADSAFLNLLAARVYSAGGDAVNSAVYLARARKADPDLAMRFAQMAPAAGSAAGSVSQRSAEAGTTPILIWGADQ